MDVSVTLQLIRQLASAPHHLRDPFAILAALQKLADEARVSGDASAPRYEAILRKADPSPPPQILEILLSVSLEAKRRARSPTPSLRCRGNGSLVLNSIPMLAGMRLNVWKYGAFLRAVLVEVLELGVPVSIVGSAATFRKIVVRFELLCSCNKGSFMYFLFFIF